MNEAQLFTILLSILSFGWIGFSAGMAWSDEQEASFEAARIAIFFLGSICLFIPMVVNLVVLVGRNF